VIRERSADLLLRRLESLGPLAEPARTFLEGLTLRRQEHAPGQEICEQGTLVRPPRLVVSGWACRVRFLADGRRQIFGFLLPGDTMGMDERLEPFALCSVVALTPVETGDLSPVASAIRGGQSEHVALAETFALAARAEQAELLDHLLRLGRLNAYERTAHLLLNLCHRLAAVGLGDRRFRLPLTQEVMADALGLSLVHVNRTLMQLRRERLVVLKGSAAELPDPERLAIVANYSPQPLQPGQAGDDAARYR
jgi:CRP-like cAMP-binding protein